MRAKNSKGTDPTPASYTWTIDTVPPTLGLTDRPPDPSASSDASFSFSADEPATFYCSLSGTKVLATAPCSSPFTYGRLANGRYTFELTSVDAVGNHSDPLSYTWQVGVLAVPSPPGLPAAPEAPAPSTPSPSTTTPPADTSPPRTHLAAGPPRQLRASRDDRRRVVFRFSSDDAGAGFVCRLDRGPAKRCASPRAYTVELGVHTFRVTAVDKAGNSDPTPTLRRFRISPPRSPGSGEVR